MHSALFAEKVCKRTCNAEKICYSYSTMSNTTFQISSRLRAELTDQNHLLTVFCDELDDYDTFKRNEDDGEWELSYDSLSNKDSEAGDGEYWGRPDFKEWAAKMFQIEAWV